MCSLNSASSLLIAIAFLNGRIPTFKCPKRKCHARHSFHLPHRSAIVHTDLACEQALCLDLTRDLFWAQAAKGLGRGRAKEPSLPRPRPNPLAARAQNKELARRLPPTVCNWLRGFRPSQTTKGTTLKDSTDNIYRKRGKSTHNYQTTLPYRTLFCFVSLVAYSHSMLSSSQLKWQQPPESTITLFRFRLYYPSLCWLFQDISFCLFPVLKHRKCHEMIPSCYKEVVPKWKREIHSQGAIGRKFTSNMSANVLDRVV